MTVGVIVLALAALGFAGATTAMALRLSGVRGERDSALLLRDGWKEEAEDARDEIIKLTRKHRQRVVALQKEVTAHRAALESLPDTKEARATVRSELDRQFGRLFGGTQREGGDPEG